MVTKEAGSLHKVCTCKMDFDVCVCVILSLNEVSRQGLINCTQDNSFFFREKGKKSCLGGIRTALCSLGKHSTN